MIEVRPAREGGELAAALALRHAVFVEEQGVAHAEELDGRDEEALQLVAIEERDVVGTCRLLVPGQDVHLGRLAVAASARRRGIGRRLLAEAERVARERGARRIVLHAQAYTVALYEAAGYVTRGATFMEAGIAHVTMERELA